MLVAVFLDTWDAIVKPMWMIVRCILAPTGEPVLIGSMISSVVVPLVSQARIVVTTSMSVGVTPVRMELPVRIW